MPSLQFKKLPLVEVAVRLSLTEFAPINLTILSKLFRDLEERFPLIEDVQQHESAPGTNSFQIGPGTNSALFKGHKNGLVLRVVGNMIAVKWIWQPQIQDYCRFSKLHEELKWCLKHVAPQIGNVRFRAANMTYVNFVQTSASSAQDTLGKYVTSGVWPSIIGGNQDLHHVNFSWRQPSGIDMRIVFERGERRVGSKATPGYKFTTVAGKQFEPTSDPEDRVIDLHDCLQVLFDDIVSQEAKAEWGYESR